MSLSPTQIPQFEQDGFLICRGLAAPDTCDQLLAITRRHVADAIEPLEYEAVLGYPGAPASLDAPGGRTIRRLRGAWQRDAAFRTWAQDPRIVDWLRQRFMEPVALTLAHHNSVMTKHPNYGTATGWHRDIRYWSYTNSDLVSVWLALGDETASNGALRVIPGSHRLDIDRSRMDDLDFLRPDVPENQALFEKGVTVELAKGDVLLFHSKLFHAAGRNANDEVKCSLVFAYHATSNAALPGSRSAAAGSVALGE